MFAVEETIGTLERNGFQNCMASLPLMERVTHPANHGYPDATFDYLFTKGAVAGPPKIMASEVSDHYSVTCDIAVHE